MDAQPSTPAEQDDQIEQAIVWLLFDPAGPPLWALDELSRELGDEVLLRDALWRLDAARLVHIVDGRFVFLSRTARRAFTLAE